MRFAIVGFIFVITACGVPSPNSVVTPSPSLAIAIGTASSATSTATGTPIAPARAATPVPTPAPTSALDARTAAQIGALDQWCLTSPPGAPSPLPLGLIGEISNGHSARETVDVLARSKCLLQPAAYGDGASEVVVIGAYRSDGAVLWVDHGYWRIAMVPIDFGYLALLWDAQRGAQRELFFEIWSGGSAGARGFVAIGITDSVTSLTLHAAPGASQMDAKRIDADHVLVTGRKLPERRWGIDSNCCLPGGHEWLWRWTRSGYELVGERQARDSYYAVNALLGAIDSGHPETASDVATGPAIDAAAAFFGPGVLWISKASGNASEQERSELLRWNLLPGGSPVAAAVVFYEVARYDPAGPSALITLERIGDGWIATDVRAGRLP